MSNYGAWLSVPDEVLVAQLNAAARSPKTKTKRPALTAGAAPALEDARSPASPPPSPADSTDEERPKLQEARPYRGSRLGRTPVGMCFSDEFNAIGRQAASGESVRSEFGATTNSEGLRRSMRVRQNQDSQAIRDTYEQDMDEYFARHPSKAPRARAPKRRRTPTDAKRSVKKRAGPVTLRIQEQYLQAIRSGEKTVEGRVNTGQAATVRVGQTLQLRSNTGEEMQVRVTSVTPYPSFRGMLEAVGLANCLPGEEDLEQGVKVYHSFPRYKSLAAAHGVVAFGVEVGDAPMEDAVEPTAHSPVPEVASDAEKLSPETEVAPVEESPVPEAVAEPTPAEDVTPAEEECLVPEVTPVELTPVEAESPVPEAPAEDSESPVPEAPAEEESPAPEAPAEELERPQTEAAPEESPIVEVPAEGTPAPETSVAEQIPLPEEIAEIPAVFGA